MRRLAVAFVSVAALLSAADIAQARDGCGPGRFYDGYRCVRMGGYGPGPGYYGAPGYYAPRAYRGNPYYSSSQRCPPRYTVQDGVCKPYRGY